jgi:putative membrane protein
MIVRDRPSPLRLFLVMRGSVLPNIWQSLLGATLLAIAVTYTHGTLWGHKIAIGAIPFTLMGLPLAIFLGFRNNAAYDRYWEGRKQWGELVSRSRVLARQCLSLLKEDDDGGAPGARMIRRAIAFAHALRHRLRGSDPAGDVTPWISNEEWERVSSAPNLTHALMLEMGADLAQCLRERRIDPCVVPVIDASLSAMTGVATACERIHGTPIPFSYTLLLHRTAYLYCLLLPFGLVDAIGDLTPLVTLLVAYTFFGLDALGDEIEEPFGTSDHDLPLEAMCRTIEIDLRTALGDTDLPPPLLPVDYRLN